MGLPFVTGSDWIWATVDFEELAADIADPQYLEDDDKKAVAAIFRKWADVLDPPQK